MREDKYNQIHSNLDVHQALGVSDSINNLVTGCDFQFAELKFNFMA